MRRKGRLYDSWASWFECDDLWSDFERNLATLSREMLVEAVDFHLGSMSVLDDSDKDFSAAEYFGSIERGTQVVSDLLYQMPKDFHRWVEQLPPPSSPMCESMMDSNALYLNFNYTEFLETLYHIPQSQICYIHGCRTIKAQPLILGHGQDPIQNLDEWYERNQHLARFRPYYKNKRGKWHKNSNLTYLAYFLEDDSKGNWRNTVRFYAVQRVREIIGEYFNDMQKKTDTAITAHSRFFTRCSSVREIIVMGHSLSSVDHPYFHKLIAGHDRAETVKWRISWYSEGDRARINRFCRELQIDVRRVSLFRMNE